MTQLPPDRDPNETPEDGAVDPGTATPGVPALQSFPHRPEPEQDGSEQQPAAQASSSGFPAPAPPTAPGAPQPAQGWAQPAGQPGYAQPGYAQPGYAQPGYPVGQPYAPAAPPMNVFAIVGFIAVFFSGIVGVILGHIALSKIKRTGEGGRGLALAATIIGYVRIGLSILGTILFFVFFGVFGAFGSAYSSAVDADAYDHGDSEFHSPGDDWTEVPDPRFSDTPWIGSENEALCTALLAPEVSIFDDPAAYYTDLLAASDDAEFSALVSELLAFAETDEQLTLDQVKQRSDAESQWAEASSQLGAVCMGEDASAR